MQNYVMVCSGRRIAIGHRGIRPIFGRRLALPYNKYVHKFIINICEMKDLHFGMGQNSLPKQW
jgi:hypothetical protein